MRLLITFFWICLFHTTFAQTPILEDYWWQPDGPVTTIEFDTIDHKLYLGGLFNSVSANVNGSAFLSKETGYPDTRFPKFVGTQPPFSTSIYVSTEDGFGGWYIGGNFDKVGDSSRSRIAHVKSTGEVSGLFKNLEINGIVYDMALDNDTLFVCGNFSGVGKVIRNVAAFDRDSGLVTPGFPETNGENVYAIISDGSEGWLMSGDFTSVGDSVRSGLVHLNEMFQVMNLNIAFNGAIYSMAISDSILYIGGTFTEINGDTRNGLAAININTGILTPFAPVVNGWVLKLAISNNKIFILGQFNSINSIPTGNFAIVDGTTGATIPENISLANLVSWEKCDLLVHNDTLYVGGHFNEGIHSNLIAVELINNSVLGWSPIIDSTVTHLEWHNDSLVASSSYFNGGSELKKIDPVTGLHINIGYTPTAIWDMTVAGDTLFIGTTVTAPESALQAINLITNVVMDWDPLITGYVYGICADENSVLAGGTYIEAVDGVKRKYFAAYNVNDGTLIELTCPQTNYDGLSCISVDGDKIYLGGNFSIVGDSLRSKVVQLNRNDGSVTAWKGISLGYSGDYVNELYVDSNTIFAGGRITYQGVNGVERNLAMINKSSGLLQPWNLSTNTYYGIQKILPVNNQLFIAGGFDSIGGQNHPYIASINPDNGNILPLNINLNNGVRDLSFDGELLYLIGTFDTINGIRRNGICSYDINLDTVTSWNPDPLTNYSITHIDAINNKVLVSGVGDIGRIQRKNFVALDAFTGQPTDLNPNPNKQVHSIVYNEDNIYISGRFDTICNTSRNLVACIDKNTGILNSWDPGMNASQAINDMRIHAGKLFVGGTFGTIDGQLRNSIASFNLPSNNLDSFYFYIYQHVYDMDMRSDTLYLGGALGIVPGSTIDVVGLNHVTEQQTSLNDSANSNGTVHSISVAGDKLIIAGDFDLFSGMPRQRLAAFDIATGNLSSWDPFWSNLTMGPLNGVSATAVYDSLLFVGGGFNFQGSTVNPPRFNIASINLTTGLMTDWNPYFSANVSELKVSGSRLFIGGSFNQNSTYFTRTNFIPLKLKSGLKIMPVQDQAYCISDTIGPVPITIEDSFDVNSVVLEAFSSDTSLITVSNILFSGSGSNRTITVIVNSGFTGICTIGIKATSQSGEIQYSNFQISNQAIQLILNNNIEYCSGDTVLIDAGVGFNDYSWNTGANTQSIFVTQPGMYSVTVSNQFGCTASGIVNVTQNALPVVIISSTTTLNICEGDSVLLNATSGFANYQWTKNSTNIPSANSSSYFANDNGNYKCVGIDTNLCSGVSNNLRVHIVCIPIGPNQEKLDLYLNNYNLEVVIQPNPSTGSFTVNTNCNGNSKIVFSVYDETFRMVRSGLFRSNEKAFVIEKLLPGIYFVKVQCGVAMEIKKIVQLN